MGYFRNPNTGKLVWSGGVANKPNPLNESMRDRPASTKRQRAGARSAVVESRKPESPKPPRPLNNTYKRDKGTPKERSKRTVPSDSPVSNGPPRSGGSYTPSTPVSRPAVRKKRSETPATPTKKTSRTPKREGYGNMPNTPNTRYTITDEPSGKVIKRGPIQKATKSMLGSMKKGRNSQGDPIGTMKGQSAAWKRAWVRYRARHKNVPYSTAAGKVDTLVTEGHKGYTSKKGFGGKGLKKPLKLPKNPDSPKKGRGY